MTIKDGHERIIQLMRTLHDDRRRLIVQRWFIVLAYGLLSIPITFSFIRWSGTESFRSIVDSFIPGPWWVWVFLTSLILMMIFRSTMRTRTRFYAFLGIPNFKNWAPLWEGSLIGFVVVSIWIAYSSVIRSELRIPDWTAWLFVLAGWSSGSLLGIVWLFRLLSSWKDGNTREVPPGTALEGSESRALSFSNCSFDEFLQWIRNDIPPELPEDDAFDHAPIARRIANRLRTSAPFTPPSQVIVGPYGSGKSTIGKMVQIYLERKTSGPTVRLVRIELWAYETPSAAAKGILSALISAVSEDADVTGLRGLQTDYVDAIKAAGGIWSTIAGLLGTTGSDPQEILKRVDQVATAIDVRYVIWVEDLERYASRVANSLQPETSKQARRLAPIRALLFGLNQCQSIKVITATTDLGIGGFDLEKVAQFIEVIPELDVIQIAQVIHRFREGCRDLFPNLIDPGGPWDRGEFDQFNNDEAIGQAMAIFGGDITHLAKAVTLFVRTPRTLKQALRRTLDFWERFPGEIDFDHLLIMNIVRESSPSAFRVVASHIKSLQNITSSTFLRPDDLPFQAQMEALEFNGDVKKSLVRIVQFIFSDTKDNAPQGFSAARGRGTKYWNRFLSEPEVAGAERDQTILKAIQLATNDEKTLVSFLEDPTRSADASYFMPYLLPLDRLINLLLLIVDRRKGEKPNIWPSKPTVFMSIPKSPPGFLALWDAWKDQMSRGNWDRKLALDTVRRAIEAAIPYNLELTSDLEYWFLVGSKRGTNPFGFELEQEAEVRTISLSQFVATYSNEPQLLARQLEGSNHWTLQYLCWGARRVEEEQKTGIPFDGWQEFRNTILEAARQNPLIMLPQLASFVVRHGRSADMGNLKFSPDSARELFDSEVAVLDLFRDQDPTTWPINRSQQDESTWSANLAVRAIIEAGKVPFKEAP